MINYSEQNLKLKVIFILELVALIDNSFKNIRPINWATDSVTWNYELMVMCQGTSGSLVHFL